MDAVELGYGVLSAQVSALLEKRGLTAEHLDDARELLGKMAAAQTSDSADATRRTTRR